jgi:sn-glycerol 3-phosphate transport system substrate-binding protein
MFTRILQRVLVTLLAATLAVGFAQKVEIEFWYGLTGRLGELLQAYVDDFNASQDEYVINGGYKGNYDDTMLAAIAASRAGTAPHIVQMFEVGTGTMIEAGDAIMPVYQLFADTGVPFDADIYLPAIKGYYSLPDGRMMSMPFNSSTPIMWVNHDALQAAGLDPETVDLTTWDDVRAVAKQVVDEEAATCGFSFAWPSWTQLENFSAWHNVPLATLSNGMEGLGAELLIDTQLHVRHIQTLMDMQAEGSFTYAGRGSAGDATFVSGECAMIIASSALYARAETEAEFDWSVRMMPYYDDVEGAPQNSIIGGASFWVMTRPGRSLEEYRGVAEFFNFISTVDNAAKWHQDTGYLPIRFGVSEMLEAEGYYDERPGFDLAETQLNLNPPTEVSGGLRLGNMPQIRGVWEEELELALQGTKTAQQAASDALERGNVVLRAFERANR